MQKIIVFCMSKKVKNELPMERPMVEQVDSALQRRVRFGAEMSLLMKRTIVY